MLLSVDRYRISPERRLYLTSADISPLAFTNWDMEPDSPAESRSGAEVVLALGYFSIGGF